ncbi:double-strand-break repair protein rad21-like protein 1 [Trichomycterus rosablanca]|uniref:double-strand-break repair protein rad21-like protein 1 n=1 Tax=Trichomycterus rosablanca TaxID=2290929 RepID=UPI002F34F1CE
MEFFTQLFTSKRGSLARIWLAAHWEKKITKAHVFECNIEMTIKDIISPQIKIGLRTSGHLLLGVVRIYFRKAKYLLADCSDAVIKIKVAFRPGQTDLPDEGMEAMFKTITLPEDFTDFESQLPNLNTIDVVDHFSLNQSRTEEITLKENFGNSFFTMDDLGDETHSYKSVLDTSLHSLGLNEDGFGDEDMAFDLVDFIANANGNALLNKSYDESLNEVPATPPPTAVNTTAVEPPMDISFASKALAQTSAMNETTLVANTEEQFTLEPVAITPSLGRKRESRKRKLVVDQSKELSNEAIKAQLDDYSDLSTTLDIAPPTRQLMDWKKNGGVDYLFLHFCMPVMNSELQTLFPREVFPGRQGSNSKAAEENAPEATREQDRHAEGERNAVPVVEMSLLQESVDESRASETASFIELSMMNPEPPQSCARNKSRLEALYPEPLSDESMVVHFSRGEKETLLTQTQQSVLESQDTEEKRMTNRVQNLLQAFKKQDSSPDAEFSLFTLCEGTSRFNAAVLFFCLLVLQKQRALDLQQSAPFSDIIIKPGPRFYKL